MPVIHYYKEEILYDPDRPTCRFGWHFAGENERDTFSFAPWRTREDLMEYERGGLVLLGRILDRVLTAADRAVAYNLLALAAICGSWAPHSADAESILYDDDGFDMGRALGITDPHQWKKVICALTSLVSTLRESNPPTTDQAVLEIVKRHEL